MVGIQPSDIICMKISTLILLIGVYTQNSIYLTYAYCLYVFVYKYKCSLDFEKAYTKFISVKYYVMYMK